MRGMFITLFLLTSMSSTPAISACVNPETTKAMDEPRKPQELGGEIITSLNKISYASFLENRCFGGSAINDGVNTFGNLLLSIETNDGNKSESNNKQTIQSIASVMSATHAQNSTSLGIFKRCTINKSDTRAFIGTVTSWLNNTITSAKTSVSLYKKQKEEWSLQMTTRARLISEYKECVAREQEVLREIALKENARLEMERSEALAKLNAAIASQEAEEKKANLPTCFKKASWGAQIHGCITNGAVLHKAGFNPTLVVEDIVKYFWERSNQNAMCGFFSASKAEWFAEEANSSYMRFSVLCSGKFKNSFTVNTYNRGGSNYFSIDVD